MKTYVRREKKAKRVTETEPYIPLNAHHEKECDTINGICPTITKSSPAENRDTVDDILDVPLAQWVPSQHIRKLRKTSVDEHRCPRSVVAWAKKASEMRWPVVVWAKRASKKMWWPAKVLIREFSAPNSGTEVAEGLLFVQYYGCKECDLLDPATDVSPFENGFQERSCNPSEEFQAALEEAIHEEQLSSRSLRPSSPVVSPWA